MVKKTGLGQGVSLLFGKDDKKYFECDVTHIKPNKHQPRRIFEEIDLEELADSIRENGVIQPLIVKYSEEGDYELIAGERRLRASKIAGLLTVPVVTVDVENEDTLLELALIENIQRTDLNPVEEAEAYKKLIDKFGYTQEQTAKRVGKKRSTVTNLLRLLKLPRHILQDVCFGKLSEGHARALIKLIDDPLRLKEVRDSILKNGLSVRQTEKIIKRISSSNLRQTNNKKQTENEMPQSYKNSLVNQLTNKLHSKVAITQNGSRGKIEIDYYSLDDFERVIGVLLNEQ